MKRIYEFARKPALRNYTIADLQNLKVNWSKAVYGQSAYG